MKKVYIISDLHDDFEAVAAFLDYAQAQEADHVLCAGDFGLRPYTAESLEKLMTTNDTETFIKEKNAHNNLKLNQMKDLFDASGIPYFCVPGNYDPLLEHIFGEHDLHQKTAQLYDINIAGYGGADAWPQQISLLVQLDEITKFDHEGLYNFLTEHKPDICLVHNPPEGLCDDMFNGQNVGTLGTTEYISEHQPKLVVSGHIHEAGPLGNNPNGICGLRGILHQNGKHTLIVNPGNLGRFELLHMPSLETHMQFDYGTFCHVEMEDDGTVKKLVQYTLSAPDRNIGTVKQLRDFDF